MILRLGTAYPKQRLALNRFRVWQTLDFTTVRTEYYLLYVMKGLVVLPKTITHGEQWVSNNATVAPNVTVRHYLGLIRTMRTAPAILSTQSRHPS